MLTSLILFENWDRATDASLTSLLNESFTDDMERFHNRSESHIGIGRY